MKLSTDQCMQCPSRARPIKLEVPKVTKNLQPNGAFCDTDYWYCSVRCWQIAVRKYLDKQYDFDAAPDQDPGVMKQLEDLDETLDYASHLYVKGVFFRQNAPYNTKEEFIDASVKKIINDWYFKQQVAVSLAEGVIDKQIQAEWMYEYEKKTAEQLFELEQSMAKDKEESEAYWAEIEKFKEKPIPDELRFSGTWIVARPGRGKTVLLTSMIIEDLKKDCSIIIFDGKGDLINPIRELTDLQDDLIIIDPDNPIALNPLDVPKTDVRKAVAQLEYLFSALLASKITPKQQTLFRSVLRALIIGFDYPTLETFKDIIVNGVKNYRTQIDRLPPDLQDFFTKEFDRDYSDTRNELVWRLRLLMENDLIRVMLNAPVTRFDLKKRMDDGKIIIINNSQALLDKDGSEFFARFFIAQLWRAATARQLQKEKKPVYVYIDECQLAIRRDDMIASILDECRSQKIAMILAHQRTEQIESKNVLSALSNCAIRISNSDEESKFFADKLRTTQEHLTSLKCGQFAVFARDVAPQAFTKNVEMVDLSKYQKITPAQHDAMRRKMAEMYGPEPDKVPERSVSAIKSPAEADKTIPRGAPHGGTLAATRSKDDRGAAHAPIVPGTIRDPSKPGKWTRG
jgi:hypothetical protein